MSRVVTVTAGIVATMLTDATSSPTVVGDHSVPNWAEMERRVVVLNKKSRIFTQKGNVTEKM